MNRWSLLTKKALIQGKRLLKRHKLICHELRKVCLYKITKWSRHFSHVTKSRIFKNRNLRKKADHNFRGTFQAPKIIFKYPKLIGHMSLSYGHFLKDKRLKFIFLRGPTFQVYVEVRRQRRLKLTKTGISSQF